MKASIASAWPRMMLDRGWQIRETKRDVGCLRPVCHREGAVRNSQQQMIVIGYVETHEHVDADRGLRSKARTQFSGEIVSCHWRASDTSRARASSRGECLDAPGANEVEYAPFSAAVDA